MTAADWPELPFDAWAETCATLHLWTQVVGKIRLAHAPMINHWWQVPLYVGSRGLTTSPIPYGCESFEIDFDFIHHKLIITTDAGEEKVVGLFPRSVADFYREYMSTLRSLGIDIKIDTMPAEFPDPIPFEQDEQHASYDKEYARRFWRILLNSTRVLEKFRSGKLNSTAVLVS